MRGKGKSVTWFLRPVSQAGRGGGGGGGGGQRNEEAVMA